MINQAIGASGVASQECKAVVQQYGQTIIDLLVSQVKAHFTVLRKITSGLYSFVVTSVVTLFLHYYFHLVTYIFLNVSNRQNP